MEFKIIPGSAVKTILAGHHSATIADVKAAYIAHHRGQTVNPDSYFLRFPDNERNRIIALPATVGGDVGVSGIKWIASFPANIGLGLSRASAVLILNDQATGYPFACLEGSRISSARTSASAVLGAYWLNGENRRAQSLAIVGAGVISRAILETFAADGWQFDRIVVHDIDQAAALELSRFAATHFPEVAKVEVAASQQDALAASIVAFATNVGKPYLDPAFRFRPDQVVLNISLRDIAPEQILASLNIFDDVDHCMKANTSPHLAEQLVGDRRFVTGTLAQLMLGEIALPDGKAKIYSPFGMGILDLSLGKKVYDEACKRGLATVFSDFFAEQA